MWSDQEGRSPGDEARGVTVLGAGGRRLQQARPLREVGGGALSNRAG